MALSPCNSTVDPSGRELVQHGTAAFPIACYHDDLSVNEVLWHWHEELEAALITEGSCVLSIGSRLHTVHAGQGFFINAGVLHGAKALNGSPCRIHSLVFHPRLVGGSEGSVFYQQYLLPLTGDPMLEWIFLQPDENWQSQALSALEQAWQLCMEEKPGFEFRVRSALTEFVWLLDGLSPALPRIPDSRALRNSDRIKRMLSCIHSRYAESLNIKSIAASASLSESECLRCFRSTIGTTPIQYLKQYRLRQAADQLLSSQDKIAEIAERCGFQDISYFTKSFREAYGCTPTEYRNGAYHMV